MGLARNHALQGLVCEAGLAGRCRRRRCSSGIALVHQLGVSLGVVGCGPHGLYALIFLKHFGVSEIVAFEPDPYRREFARSMGCALDVLDPNQPDVSARVAEHGLQVDPQIHNLVNDEILPGTGVLYVWVGRTV